MDDRVIPKDDVELVGVSNAVVRARRALVGAKAECALMRREMNGGKIMAVDDVKGWMQFIGWSDGGEPGSVKLDAGGKQVARHGDATWIKDVQDCCDRVERSRIVAELERRDRILGGIR